MSRAEERVAAFGGENGSMEGIEMFGLGSDPMKGKLELGDKPKKGEVGDVALGNNFLNGLDEVFGEIMDPNGKEVGFDGGGVDSKMGILEELEMGEITDARGEEDDGVLGASGVAARVGDDGLGEGDSSSSSCTAAGVGGCTLDGDTAEDDGDISRRRRQSSR